LIEEVHHLILRGHTSSNSSLIAYNDYFELDFGCAPNLPQKRMRVSRKFLSAKDRARPSITPKNTIGIDEQRV
jgi:hypothetical protein